MKTIAITAVVLILMFCWISQYDLAIRAAQANRQRVVLLDRQEAYEAYCDALAGCIDPNSMHPTYPPQAVYNYDKFFELAGCFNARPGVITHVDTIPNPSARIRWDSSVHVKYHKGDALTEGNYVCTEVWSVPDTTVYRRAAAFLRKMADALEGKKK